MCLHACPAAVQLSLLTPYQDSPSLQDHVAKEHSRQQAHLYVRDG